MKRIRRMTIGCAAAICLCAFGAAAEQEKLSGSELLRAERCANLYDCDEDGSWSISGESGGSDAIICAEREVLLMVLLESQASDDVIFGRMSAEEAMLIQARAACDKGRIGDATMLYDQLITQFERSLAQNNQ